MRVIFRAFRFLTRYPQPDFFRVGYNYLPEAVLLKSTSKGICVYEWLRPYHRADHFPA